MSVTLHQIKSLMTHKQSSAQITYYPKVTVALPNPVVTISELASSSLLTSEQAGLHAADVRPQEPYSTC